MRICKNLAYVTSYIIFQGFGLIDNISKWKIPDYFKARDHLGEKASPQ